MKNKDIRKVQRKGWSFKKYSLIRNFIKREDRKDFILSATAIVAQTNSKDGTS